MSFIRCLILGSISVIFSVSILSRPEQDTAQTLERKIGKKNESENDNLNDLPQRIYPESQPREKYRSSITNGRRLLHSSQSTLCVLGHVDFYFCPLAAIESVFLLLDCWSILLLVFWDCLFGWHVAIPMAFIGDKPLCDFTQLLLPRKLD